MNEEKTFYLTKEGLKKIKKEYEDLKKIKLMKTKGDTPKILHSEDVNPEYLSLQEDLSLLDIRISELEGILKNTKLIKSPPKGKQAEVNLGATVRVSINGQEDEFTIVGTLEANPSEGRISNESPVGKILIGRKIGEEIAIDSAEKIIYKIKKIKYSVS